MLQYINTIHSLSMVIGAYRANIMDNLPWRMIRIKGVVKLIELILFDMNEWPSIHITNYVRDDCVCICAYIFYMFSVENKRYNEKMRWIMAKQQRAAEIEKNDVKAEKVLDVSDGASPVEKPKTE
jgi:hypothetical protein